MLTAQQIAVLKHEINQVIANYNVASHSSIPRVWEGYDEAKKKLDDYIDSLKICKE